ncbi:gamma-glutamylcyclotransferase [Halalkalicoccus salilacus]|uniref:gamma-glutamylcyclotransferase n=1 Tax=Halalkalicoccus TaxID=332246 RepID=UPI002F966537
MDSPPDITLPFFAYGTLKPEQPGYHLIEDIIAEPPISAKIRGALFEQDGLPIFVEKYNDDVRGYVLKFSEPEEAYNRIADYENERNYEWDVTIAETDNQDFEVNVLIATDPVRGRVDRIENNWTVGRDPLFTEALDVVKHTKNTVAEVGSEQSELEKFFRLQMAYLLLWSSIERYNAFRFGLSAHSVSNRKQMASLDGFRTGLKTEVPSWRIGEEIFSADRNKFYTLDPDKPEEAIEYYYQVRSNVTHRGKSSGIEYGLMHDSLDELSAIFRHYVLE